MAYTYGHGIGMQRHSAWHSWAYPPHTYVCTDARTL